MCSTFGLKWRLVSLGLPEAGVHCSPPAVDWRSVGGSQCGKRARERIAARSCCYQVPQFTREEELVEEETPYRSYIWRGTLSLISVMIFGSCLTHDNTTVSN